jgi:hypothetical protein
MATTYHNDIQKLYVAYFNRPADVGGLNYWETVVEAANGSTAAVSAAFAASPEYKAAYAGLNTAGIVNEIYNNLFGRDAETTGLDYWVGVINAGSFTIDQAVAIISEAAQGTDKVAFTSKVSAANTFTTSLDTPAEQAGYSGDDANAVAKAWLAGITTAESLATATAPAALAATVTDVVKAGTPFTVAGALAALAAAEEAVADFLDDEDDATDAVAEEAALTASLNTAVADIDAEVAADFTAATPGVRAALIADQVKTLAGNVVTARTTHTEALADASAKTGLVNALNSYTAATASVEAAEKVQDAAEIQLAGAKAVYEAKQAVVTIEDNGTVTGVITFNSSGKLVVNPALTGDAAADAAALLTAIQARETADATVVAAQLQEYYAEIRADLLDAAGTVTAEAAAVGAAIPSAKDPAAPTANEIVSQLAALNQLAVSARLASNKAIGDAALDTAADTAEANFTTFAGLVDAYLAADLDPLGGAVTTAAANLTAAQEAVTEFNELVSGYTEANNAIAQLAILEAAVVAAQETFTDADVEAPVTLTAVTVATAESDIFLAGDLAAATLVNFGDQGTDSLYIGTDFTLNKSTTVANGDNSKLEVFFIQNGADVEVHLETEVFGSASTTLAENVITITGVNVADLTLANGIITAA